MRTKVAFMVWAIQFPYEEPSMIFATREDAEKALADTSEFPPEYGPYIAEYPIYNVI